MIKKKEKVFFIILMEINLKENGKMIKKKEKEFFIILMEIHLKDFGKMILN